MDFAQELKRRAIEFRSRPTTRNQRLAELFESLALPENHAVGQWMIANHSSLKSKHRRSGTDTPATMAVSLALRVVTTKPLAKWEALPSIKRTRRLDRIAKLARDLAGLLEKPDSPTFPVALDLFDPEKVPSELRLGLHMTQPQYVHNPLRDQQVAPMMRELAAHAEQGEHRVVRDSRPLTGTPYARVLARNVGAWFELHYGVTPNDVVADIVNIGVPELDGSVDGDAIREWRGKK